MSPRSAETLDEPCGKLQNRCRSPTSVFRRSLKSRLLERAGIFAADDPPQNTRERGEMGLQCSSKEPDRVNSDSSRGGSQLLWESQTSNMGGHVCRSSDQFAISKQHNADHSPHTGQYLSESTSTRGPDGSSSYSDVLWEKQSSGGIKSPSVGHQDLIGSQSATDKQSIGDKSPYLGQLPGLTRVENLTRFASTSSRLTSDILSHSDRISPSFSHQDSTAPHSTASKCHIADRSPETGSQQSTRAESLTRFSGADSRQSSSALCMQSAPVDGQVLIASQTSPSKQHNADKSPQPGAESESRSFPFLLSALISPSSVTRAVYPGSVYRQESGPVCRQGLSYQEAAALFYSQLAAVQQLQQQSGTAAQPRL